MSESVTISEEVRPYTYDHIPQLRELMPTTGGIPGVTYLQVTVSNQRTAQDDGWGNISGGSRIYTIIGPKGPADMQLMCKGKPIPGGDTNSGSRKCMVDANVEGITGLFVNPPEEPPEVEEAPPEILVEKDAISTSIANAVKD